MFRACYYGSVQHNTWITKGNHSKGMIRKLKYFLGETTHTDIMTISVPGLGPRMAGFLGSKQFHYASFLTDDRSDYTFVHHQFSTSIEETIKDKNSYEHDITNHGKEVRHCHVGNGTCATASCKKEINDNKQTLTFCGVGSHRQNRKAEIE